VVGLYSLGSKYRVGHSGPGKRLRIQRRDGWTVMSKRFLRWVETNPDIESHETRAERLTDKLFAEAAAAGFSKFEAEEERERIPSLVQTAVADSTDFDVDAYILKSQLARENEDGD